MLQADGLVEGDVCRVEQGQSRDLSRQLAPNRGLRGRRSGPAGGHRLRVCTLNCFVAFSELRLGARSLVSLALGWFSWREVQSRQKLAPISLADASLPKNLVPTLAFEASAGEKIVLCRREEPSFATRGRKNFPGKLPAPRRSFAGEPRSSLAAEGSLAPARHRLVFPREKHGSAPPRAAIAYLFMRGARLGLMTVRTGPHLRLTALHIRGLPGITQLDLPEERTGWKGAFPDVAVIEGPNGSGKTTLLRYIATALR